MGVTTASLTDFIIASSTATFHTPFVELGLPPEGCSSFNFARLMGEANAKVQYTAESLTVLQRLIADAEKVDAITAQEIGLVGAVVSPEELLKTAKQIGFKMALRIC